MTIPRLSVCALILCALSLRAAPAQAQVPRFNHVFIVIFENEEASSVVGNPAAPFFNQLAARYGIATRAYGETHPSLPNYMALTSGTTAFTDDCVGCVTTNPSIADRLEAAGRTWTAYLEDFPGGCGTSDSGLYAAKHNPFAHYANIASNPARCAAHMAPFSRFASDLASGSLPDYVWITPNLCSDMHDCPVSTGDAWLQNVASGILSSPAFAGSALFVVFDEGTSDANGGGQVPLIVASPWTPAGYQSSAVVNHYNVLRTIEDAWGLAPLGASSQAAPMTDFFPQQSTGAAEQVIYAADASITGGWTRIADATAAGGLKLSNADLGAAALDAPLASPGSYVEASFTAQPSTRYRVWLRMHAQGDSKWNDSVFVQFSDSVDSQGSARYRIGTSGGYVVNLWTCATCQSFGWGWQRNAYWLADTGDVWFAGGGTHSIRIQAREDGVEIDQIVISPSTFASAAPGPVSGDGTIVPRSGEGSPAPPPSGGSSPFTGTPAAIPGVVNASDFDAGGEGVAYHDTSSGNTGGAYRGGDVDIQPSADGGFNVGWVAPGEWLRFTVTVASAGAYDVTFRVASPGAGGTFHLEMNGADVTGPIAVPATGDWQAWQSVTRRITLTQGTQSARLVFDAVGASGALGNFNTISFAGVSTPASTPYGGTPVSLPGTIEAEQFDSGGEGVAYHDTSAGNSGGAFRSNDVDIEAASGGGYDVGWISAGEWLQYTVNVSAAGSYSLAFRVACLGAGGTLHVEANGVNITGPVTVPDTGWWQTWQTVTRTVTLASGVQTLRVVMDAAGVNAVGNLDWIAVTAR
jgi:hypothetical protein